MSVSATLGWPSPFLTSSQRYEPGLLIAGKYRLESELGEGGMGTVWLARNETLDSLVALKLIRSGMQRAETEERLLLEARVEARLRHPNIVRVFDFGRTDLGDGFIVMEVLDGIDLGKLLMERGRLDAREAVQLVLPVIMALCHAHESGVVHRDLKPHNIFVDRGGLHAGIKLLDFGIAKLMGDDSRHFTEGGTLLGSPAYMAPEQARGLEDVDHRADIWSICVVLYEAISGTPAFPGEGYEALRKVIEDEVPALVETGAGESALWRILSRGLRKEPSRRYQSMGELGTALAQWLCNQGRAEDLDGNRISRSWGVTPQLDQAAPSSVERREPMLQPPRPRPRRNVQVWDFSPDTIDAYANELRRGIGPRVAHALRMVAAGAFAIAIVAAPSKTGVEAEVKARTEPVPVPRAPVAEQALQVPRAPVAEEALQVPRAPAAEQASMQLTAPAPPPDAPVSQAPPMRAAPAPRRHEPRHPSYPKPSSRPLTETDLGLKVPY